MSGTDSNPAQGIEPATSGLGPPPTPDFGVEPRRRSDRRNASDERSAEPGAPYSPAPRWATPAVMFAIVIVAIVTIGLIAVGVGKLMTLKIPTGVPPWSASQSDDPSADEVDPANPAAVETALQAKIDQYRGARDNGALWKKIPDTSFNRTAVSAFLYLLTDMKLAAGFGADTSDYIERADELEQKLLNEEPLGSDIEIILSDRTFTYDGTTGEGGYTSND